MAEEHDADVVFDPLNQDVTAEVRKITGGKGADVVFDAAGMQPSITLAIDAVRPRGHVMDIALWGNDPAKIDMNKVLAKEITITGQCAVGVPCESHSLNEFLQACWDTIMSTENSWKLWGPGSSRDWRS